MLGKHNDLLALLVGDPFPQITTKITVPQVFLQAGLRRAGPVEAEELKKRISICLCLLCSGVLWGPLGFFCCSSGVLSRKITAGIALNKLIPLRTS